MCSSAMMESGAYVMQGVSDFQSGKLQDKLLKQQGQREVMAANDDASRIRREGERIEGSNRAGLAAAGLDMGSASAQAIAAESASEVQRDVDLTLYRGRVADWDARTQGKIAKHQGRMSLINNSLKAYAAFEKNVAGAVAKGAGGGA